MAVQDPSRPIVVPLLAANDPEKLVGWTLTRFDATTLQQREYLRRLEMWHRHKLAGRAER